MWILDSLSEVPVKKPFLILWIATGAASLLLSYLFALNGLFHPVTFTLIAAASFFVWKKEKTILSGMVIPLVLVSAWFVLPKYPALFCVIVSFLLGKMIFSEQFRIWKWIAVTALFLISFPILTTWQNIPELLRLVPYPFTTLIHAAVLAFCVQFSLLPYQLRKDSVVEAFEHYPWKTSYDAFRMAAETVDLYTRIKRMVKEQETNPKIEQELEDYTERVIHQCYKLHQITYEISSTNFLALEKQIAQLKEKLELAHEVATKLQYEQAISNKQKQMEHYEKLRLQQERLTAQIVNYNSSLENLRFAYSHQDFQRSAGMESIEMFMDVVKARVEGFSYGI
jgi:hypothetical protein